MADIVSFKPKALATASKTRRKRRTRLQEWLELFTAILVADIAAQLIVAAFRAFYALF